MKPIINFLFVFLMIVFVGCGSSNNTQRSSGTANSDGSDIGVQTLADHLRKIPRLEVIGTEGNITVLTKGISSVNKSLEPLFVVNGIQMGRQYQPVANAIDIHTIVSVDYVNSNRATVKYGEAGRNGVVEIKTQVD